MKSVSGLIDSICSWENLLLAEQNARRGKASSPAASAFHMDREAELLRLQSELSEGTYVPGEYRQFLVRERKPRLISAAPYRDRVVHHAICNIIEPIFEPRFIADSYACRRGKGQHRACDRYQHYCRRFPYVLQCDVRGYFPSIDREILETLLFRVIRCRPTRRLLTQIIETAPPTGSTAPYLPGDDLFAPHMRARGLPIGNLTSQFFANVYLDGLDHTDAGPCHPRSVATGEHSAPLTGSWTGRKIQSELVGHCENYS